MSTLPSHALAGALAGLLADLTMHPIDTLKARLQSSPLSPQSAYRSLPHALPHLLRPSSARTLYAGLGPVLLGSAPTHAIIFTVYRAAQEPLHSDLLAGALAETAALATYVPAEVVAKRMQVRAVLCAKSAGLPSCAGAGSLVRWIYRREGLRGFYRGLWPTLWRDVPFTALQLALFDAVKKVWVGVGGELKGGEAAAVGFGAGAVAAAVTNPVDVLKTRMQVGEEAAMAARVKKVGGAVAEVAGQPRSMAWWVRRLWAEEGWPVLWRGLGARVAWVAPASAITLAVYERAAAALLGRPAAAAAQEEEDG